MRIRTFISLLLVLLVSISSGCTLFDKKHIFDTEKEIYAVSYHYWQRGNESETVDDWYMALFFYQIAHQLDPENEDIQIRIRELDKKIQRESHIHFQRGFDFYRNGEIMNARQAFLTTLRINPDHQKARIYLVEILQQPEQNTYEVNRKTDFKAIAQEFYNDPDKSFLIAYFNDLLDQDFPPVGSILLIPWVPVQKSTSPFQKSADPFDLEKNIEIARIHMESKQFSQALAMTSKIREHDPDNLKIIEIENAVYHQIAQEFERFGKYTDALNTMRKVKSENPAGKSYMSHLEKMVKVEAEKHYRRGVRHFLNEELEKAIKEWEKTLAIDPTNELAIKDIANAKSLLEKLRQIQ